MLQKLIKLRWAMARLTFITYIGLSMVTLVGGFLTAPLMTWYFYGDWRFWRHWSSGRYLMPHAWRLLKLMRKDDREFMFSVPLTSPPRSAPAPGAAALHPDWTPGPSCGGCTNCCRAGGHACPLLDETANLCRGYDSFYWRYFNCGRFPSTNDEISYYDCRKWVINPIHWSEPRRAAPAFAEPEDAMQVGIAHPIPRLADRSDAQRSLGGRHP